MSFKTERCKEDTAPPNWINSILDIFKQKMNDEMKLLADCYTDREGGVAAFCRKLGMKSVTTDSANGNYVTLGFADDAGTG